MWRSSSAPLLPEAAMERVQRPAAEGDHQRPDDDKQGEAALDESRHAVRFIVVEGEAGIGKTRLVDELRILGAARDALVVWGRSDEGGAAPALWPWLAPLRALAREAGDVRPVLAELVAGDQAEHGAACTRGEAGVHTTGSGHGAGQSTVSPGASPRG